MQTMHTIMELNGLISNSTPTLSLSLNRLGCRFLPLERYQYRSFLRMDPSPLFPLHFSQQSHCLVKRYFWSSNEYRILFILCWPSEWTTLFTFFVGDLVYTFRDYFVCWHCFTLVESQHQHFSILEFKQFYCFYLTHII